MIALLSSLWSTVQTVGIKDLLGNVAMPALMIFLIGFQTCRLDAARTEITATAAAHEATQRDLAHTRGLWLIDQRAANATIQGLQKQLSGTLADFAAYRAEEAQRSAIARAAAPRPRTAAEKSEVVDDATRRRAVDFLNAW